METTGYTAFSPDSQYLAFCGNDGKLKIWETLTNRLKHEYVPNLHLSSPCSVLGWIIVSSNTSTTPWKKRKRKSISEESEQKGIVAMGSTNGTISLYDVSSTSICGLLENGHAGTITSLTWSAFTGLFTAAEDKQIVQWNIHENSIKCKWKSGKSRGKVTAMAVLTEGQYLLTADQEIKWWDLSTKQVIKTFTKLTGKITSLYPVKINNETSYLVSSSSNEAYLYVWSLNESTKENTLVATLTTHDVPTSVSVRLNEDNQIMILSATKEGQAYVFKYQRNGINSKPVKPILTVMIVSDSNHKTEPIRILKAELTADLKMLLAYGAPVINFEKVAPDFSDKVQCLIRTDIKKLRDRKEETISKIKIVDTESTVEYLVPGSTGTTPKRKGSSTGAQLPLKNRLENLSLNDVKSTPGQVQAKGESMVQLLIQGLQSKERNILQNVLYITKENVIKNTVAKLPIQAIIPLLKELTLMLQGKSRPCKIAVMWLKALVAAHAGQLISHPDITDSLAPILSFIDAKLMLFTEISRLRGRVSLVTGQISNASEKQDRDITENTLLVYQDPDSSDDDTDVGEVDMSSESEENWEEFSDLDAHEDAENCKSDDDVSMCS